MSRPLDPQTKQEVAAQLKSLLKKDVGRASFRLRSLLREYQDLVRSEVHEEIKNAVPECELIGRSLQLSFSEETRSHVQEASSAIGLAYTGMLKRP